MIRVYKELFVNMFNMEILFDMEKKDKNSYTVVFYMYIILSYTFFSLQKENSFSV